jgi:hypothetical protein
MGKQFWDSEHDRSIWRQFCNDHKVNSSHPDYVCIRQTFKSALQITNNPDKLKIALQIIKVFA